MITTLLSPAPPLPVPLRRPPAVGSGEPRLAPPARRVQENRPAAEAAPVGSPLVGLAGQGLDWVEGGPRDRGSRHRAAVAAAALPRALDQALGPAHWGPPARQRRAQGPGHPDGGGESPVGRAPNPWRTAEAGDRGGRADRVPATAEAADPAVADLADVPYQPRPRPGLGRFLHRAHRGVAHPIRLRRARPLSATGRPLQRHRASYRRLDGPADRGGVSGRQRASLPPPRSGHDLWPRLPATLGGHADP